MGVVDSYEAEKQCADASGYADGMVVFATLLTIVLLASGVIAFVVWLKQGAMVPAWALTLSCALWGIASVMFATARRLQEIARVAKQAVRR